MEAKEGESYFVPCFLKQGFVWNKGASVSVSLSPVYSFSTRKLQKCGRHRKTRFLETQCPEYNTFTACWAKEWRVYIGFIESFWKLIEKCHCSKENSYSSKLFWVSSRQFLSSPENIYLSLQFFCSLNLCQRRFLKKRRSLREERVLFLLKRNSIEASESETCKTRERGVKDPAHIFSFFLSDIFWGYLLCLVSP